jgi:hypothetical protein
LLEWDCEDGFARRGACVVHCVSFGQDRRFLPGKVLLVGMVLINQWATDHMRREVVGESGSARRRTDRLVPGPRVERVAGGG